MTPNTETMDIARAKVNLTLHVGAVIKDPHDPFFGYHPLDSLVIFADVGDRIHARTLFGKPDNTALLNISGPFGEGLSVETDNLIIRAYNLVAAEVCLPAMEFSLEKNLPVAAGLGGGSANAAAVLRLLQNHVDLPPARWHAMALQLGADVPVCLLSKTARMTGIGECVKAIATVESFYAVLVNPGIAVSTRDVFKHFDAGDLPSEPKPQLYGETVKEQALKGENDLESVAIQHVLEVKTVLDALKSQPGCYLARMSGSGATCFGLFSTELEAEAAWERLTLVHSGWWSYKAHLG